MRLQDIALNNLRRRKLKMAFVMFGMVFGVATIVTLFAITATMQAEMQGKVKEAGTKIIITPQSDHLSYSYGGITIDTTVAYDVTQMSTDAITKVEKLPEVSIVAPKVLGAAKSNGLDVVVVGVDFTEELSAKPHWQPLGQVPKQRDEVLIGSKVARKLKLNLQNNIDLAGTKYTVSGMLKETGAEEDGLIFMDITAAQELLKKQGQLSFMEVVAFKDQEVTEERIKALVATITKALPQSDVTAVATAVEARRELVNRFANFSMVISFIVLLVGSLIVMTTMMSAVNERTREIGILRAIGFRKSHVMRIILMEAGLVSLFSGVIGYFVGMFTAVWVAPLVVDLQGAVVWSPVLAISVVLLATLTGLLAGWYPAVKATKLDPAEALRFI